MTSPAAFWLPPLDTKLSTSASFQESNLNPRAEPHHFSITSMRDYWLVPCRAGLQNASEKRQALDFGNMHPHGAMTPRLGKKWNQKGGGIRFWFETPRCTLNANQHALIHWSPFRRCCAAIRTLLTSRDPRHWGEPQRRKLESCIPHEAGNCITNESWPIAVQVLLLILFGGWPKTTD